MAVTPHHLATSAAIEIMHGGGNAVDAVIAANAVLGMVLPTTCGIGGDLFAIVHRPGEVRPEVLNASGRAGSSADPDALRTAGHTAIPLRSRHSVTVPGCVDGWEHLLSRHGSMALGALLEPAIALGTDGFAVSAELAADLDRIASLVAGEPAAQALYPDGAPPVPGTVVRRPDLATTLTGIAGAGRHAFYEGPVAAAIAAATGGAVTAGDLAANRPDWVTAVGTEVFGLTGWTVPPNSQGYLTLGASIVLEAIGPPADARDPAFHHAAIEAYRSVAWERDRFVADPRFTAVEPDELVDRARLAGRVAAFDPDRVASWPAAGEAPGGTAYFCAIDGDGMAVSAIQSNFHGIGTGISAGDTGVFLHNRGDGFNLVPGHANELAPGKRPLHTLSPTLWTRGADCALILGTRGGDHQPEYLTQMVALMLVAGLDPGDAQAHPRWHIPSFDGDTSVVSVEAGMPEAIVDGLTRRGHVVDGVTEATTGWGPVSVIAVDESGTRHGAADPRISTARAAGA